MTSGPDDYRFSRDLAGQGEWIRVSGGNLPMPIEVAFGRAPDGRRTVTGLRIGTGAPGQEITSATLRTIKLSEIQAAYFEAETRIYQAVGVLDEESAAAMSRPLRSAARGPTNDQLRRFADVYKAALDAKPSRAMTTTARALNMSRATANRWAALCRELGYLPNPSEGETSS